MILFMICLFSTSNALVPNDISNITKTLVEKFNVGDRVMVFYSGSYKDSFRRLLICDSIQSAPEIEVFQGLVKSKGDFVLEAYNSSSLKLNTADEQRKNIAANTIIIVIDGNEDEILKFIEVLRTMRIISVNTKIFFFLIRESTIAEKGQILKSFWIKLKVFKIILIEIQRNSRYFYRDPNGSLLQINIDKFRFTELNFTGYNLIAAAVPAVPPIIFEPAVPLKYTDGTLIRLITTICQNLGMTISYVETKNKERSRLTSVNGTFQGLFGMLHRQEVDIILSDTFVINQRVAAAEPLPCVWQLELVWCAPKNFDSEIWKTISGALSWDVWLSTFLVFLSIVLVIYFKNRLDDSGYTFQYIALAVFAISLQKNILPSNRFLPFRLLFGALLIFFLMISTCYMSGVVTLMKLPPPSKQIETLLDAYDSGMKFASVHGIDRKSQIELHLGNKTLAKDKYVQEDDFSELIKLVLSKSAVSLLTDMIWKLKANEQDFDGESLVHVLPGIFHAQMTSCFISPGHPLQPLISDYFYRLIETGFPEHWEKMVVHSRKWKSKSKLQKFGPKGTVTSQKALSLNQVLVFFHLHLSLLFICFVTFIFEILLRNLY